jgi:membrane protease YdiL (CAAX protease family)
MALLLTSVLFSLMHGFNPEIGWLGFANIFLAGLWLGIARVITGTLWLAIGLHTGWNFFLGSVFGFPVSGIYERSVLITETDGPAVLTGGAFGPEGGLLATVVLLLGAGALYIPRVRVLLADRAQPSIPKEETEDSP